MLLFQRLHYDGLLFFLSMYYLCSNIACYVLIIIMKRWPGDTRHDDTCFVPPASFHFFLRVPVTDFVPKVSHKVSLDSKTYLGAMKASSF